MESTTLDQIAESLLENSEPGEAQERNSSDAENEITDLSDDNQDKEVEAEIDNNVDSFNEDDDEGLIDDEVLADAEAEDTNLIPVKVDGKEEMWTLEKLKQSAAGQSAINKRFQEAAEVRKQLEQERIALSQQQEQVLQLYQQAQQGNLQAPIPPSRELFESDPIGYMEEKLKYDEAKAGYDQQLFQIQQIHHHTMQQRAQAHQTYLQEQAEILRQHIPDIADPEKGEKLKSDLMQAGMDYGFTPEEMAQVSDARYIRALNDARKYRQLVKNRAQAQQKGEKARPVVRAGAKRHANASQATQAKNALLKMKKTGDVDDAVNFLLS